MTYEEFINNILETRGRFACGDEYHERHHIIPRCLDGTNNEDNLIDLFAREHFEAHRLLVLENPDNNKLISAWWLMSHAKGNDNQQWYELTSGEYEESRSAFVASISGENNFWYNRIIIQCTNCGKEIKVTPYNYNKCNKNGEHHNFCSTECYYDYRSKYYLKENHSMYGKRHSEETRSKLSSKAKERFENPENNPMYGKHLSKEACQIISEKAKERYKNPHNHLTGKNNKLSKIINQYDGDVFVQTWYGAKEIKRQLGIDDTQIIGCCKHKKGYRTAGGFVWYYADDPTQPDPTKIIPNKMIKEEQLQ